MPVLHSPRRQFRYLLLAVLLGCQPTTAPAPVPETPVPETPAPSQTRDYPEGKARGLEVKDGDSFFILCKGRRFEVRLAWVDAPEADQPFGMEAGRFTRNRVQGKDITFIKVGLDSRNRGPTGDVILENGKSLCEELVTNGYAWNYWFFTKQEPEKYQLYNALEQQARREKRGFWQGDNPIYPREWRQWRRYGIRPTGNRD